MKKTISVALIVILLVSALVLPVGAAATGTNDEIAAEAENLEKKFGINITYETGADENALITLNNLEMLDKAFSSVTPSVVKQVSKYYEKLNGKKINIIYVVSDNGYNYNGGVLMAAFEHKSSKIFVFLPSVAGQAIISGENPIALVHEFAHAFHLMTMDLYGEQKMASEWSKFNRGKKYNSDLAYTNPDDEIFISSYASSSFEEDFAETFAHTFIRTRPGQGFKNRLSSDSKMTGLGQKVAYIENLIPVYLDNTDPAIENYHKIYETAISMKFEGMKFSGDYLQYIGYPQPKNILKGILNGLDKTSQKSTWVRKLGAWRVIDENGDMIFIFPGGTWTSQSKALEASAA